MSGFLPRFVDFGGRTIKHFAGIHHGLAERWMRMNRFGNVPDNTTHFDRQCRFGNQFACSRSNDTATKYPFGFRINDPFCQTVGDSESLTSTAGSPRIGTNFVGDAISFGFLLGDPRPGDFRIGKYDRRNRPFVPLDRFSPR